MPVYQVYFPDSVSSDIEELAKSSGMKSKELIQEAVGEKIKKMKDKEKTSKKKEKVALVPVPPSGENNADN